jgi:hypothetical protein
MKNSKKTQEIKNKKFICIPCSFGCNNKNDFNRHLITSKHKRLTDTSFTLTKKTHNKNVCVNCCKKFKHRQSLYNHKKICKSDICKLSKISQNYPKVIQNKFVCKCGKSYKYSSGLCKHKTKCKHLYNVNENTEIVPKNNVEKLLEKLIEKNNDILEENKVLRKEIKNLKLGNTMINSNNNNNNNNSFNINMFLNEKCKNAMNIEDFVEKIKLSLEDLQFTKDNGYAKGISNIFIKNLNDMDITERPIHCSDQKRLQFYVKNDNEWSKDKNNKKLDNTIEKVSRKQMKSIQEWVEANPDYTESDAKMEEYFTLVRSITQPNDDKNLKNIKRKVGESVKLEKSENVK